MFQQVIVLSAALATGSLTNGGELKTSLEKLAASSDGRVGVCALDLAATTPVCANGDQKFPLQSVMKLVVAAAVLDAVDQKKFELDTVITLLPKDASPGPQEFADMVRKAGSLRVTVRELIRRAVVDSDSTAIDTLIEHLGGVVAVKDFMRGKDVVGLSVDRDERHLQAESVGITWRPEYSDTEKFEAAVKALPGKKHDEAATAYLTDPRDTATPEGMVAFLKALATEKLLSAASTHHLLDVMASTSTGKNRLKAGLPSGWSLGHKTGSGRTWKELCSATNDVGILTAPDGKKFAVAVFVTASKRPEAERAAVIANAAKLVTGAVHAN